LSAATWQSAGSINTLLPYAGHEAAALRASEQVIIISWRMVAAVTKTTAGWW
jgi:hypothetical protein